MFCPESPLRFPRFITYRTLTSVTIRKTLLRAFLLIGLIPAILLAALAFYKARTNMQTEIERSLVAQAEAVSAEVSKMMFERLQNAATWSTLEVMQDLQVQDVDKRLSNFLAKLKIGYGGVYVDLFALDHDRRILSSSNATTLGQLRDAQPAWQSLRLAGANLTLEYPQRSHAAATLTIRTPIFYQGKATALGELALEFDWSQIDALLDNAAADSRMVAMVDGAGHVVAASRNLDTTALTHDLTQADWQLASRAGGAFEHRGPLLV
jgi:hypothetical protein